MARYKKNTLECDFCGNRKHKSHFSKNEKGICQTCWRLYFKILPPQSTKGLQGLERKNLHKLSFLFKDNIMYRRALRQILIQNDGMSKMLRKCLRFYGKKSNMIVEIEQIIQSWSGVV